MPGFATGTLWKRIREVSARAEFSGALQPIPTDSLVIEDGGIRFGVRIVDDLRRKQQQRARQHGVSEPPANPFLPPDPELFVADLSDTHVCVLNKFEVLDHHLLIVTREFADQEALLDEQDMAALWTCLGEVEGLGFYNGGVAAGASQRHKHLQLAPYPLGTDGPGVPLERCFGAARFEGDIGRIDTLPFGHALCWLRDLPAPAGEAAGPLAARYLRLMTAVGLPPGPDGIQTGPYNLLVTREWMMAVPRSREHFEGISINAIGFAGSLLVQDDSELQQVRRTGPMAVLARTGKLTVCPQ